jgi:AraC-like DNA-binding protein
LEQAAFAALTEVSQSNATLRVSSVFVGALADAVRQCGVPTAALLGGSAAQRVDRDVSLADLHTLYMRALELTARPGLGLLWGANANGHSFDVVGYLVPNARTLRDALEVCAQFHPLALEGGSLRVSEHTGRARVECGYPFYQLPSTRGLAEFVISGLFRLLQVYGAEAPDVYAACFTHPKPQHHGAYAELFAGIERFSQPFTGLEFDARLLDRPHLHSRPELHALLRAQAERKLDQIARPLTFVERLDMVLRRLPPASVLSMPEAARALGMSVRSLRRRLDEEGASYREMAESARKEAAYAMLRKPDLSVQETSHALGFSSPTAFHRAFKRWAGITPAQYRDKHCAG